ncbi:MAG TPA: hypothetical protein VIQ02_01880 [Jiangellaceae bacterium]
MWFITGRDTDSVANAVGSSDSLLVAGLNVTRRQDAGSAWLSAVPDRGRPPESLG